MFEKPEIPWNTLVISEIPRTPEGGGNNPINTTLTAGAIFQINNAKSYVLVVTLFVNDHIKFLENIKQGFKTKISWNKYRSDNTAKKNNNNLNYLVGLIQNVEISIDCFYFYSKMVIMILQKKFR